MNDEIKNSFRQGVSQKIFEGLPGLTKAAHEMLVNDIMSSIESSEEINAAKMFAGEDGGIEKAAGVFLDAVGKTAGGLAVAGLGGLSVHNFLKAKKNEELINQYSNFQNTLAHVAQRNERLANENADRLNELGDSIFKFAPSVANDPNVLETVLDGAVQYGGLDTQTVRSLQELEERYHKLQEVPTPKSYLLST